jgi:hypothetical protein
MENTLAKEDVMTYDETYRAIIDALLLPPDRGKKLLEALDVRYQKFDAWDGHDPEEGSRALDADDAAAPCTCLFRELVSSTCKARVHDPPVREHP